MSNAIDCTPYTPEQLHAAEMANDLPSNMKVRALPKIRATVAALVAAQADNDRLRALVKAAESVECYCPWCHSVAVLVDLPRAWRHAADCPAFTPEGEVRR